MENFLSKLQRFPGNEMTKFHILSMHGDVKRRNNHDIVVIESSGCKGILKMTTMYKYTEGFFVSFFLRGHSHFGNY